MMSLSIRYLADTMDNRIFIKRSFRLEAPFFLLQDDKLE